MEKIVHKKNTIFLIFLFYCISVFSVAFATDRENSQIAQKIQELRAIYQKKKTDGYDLRDVEKNMVLLQKVRSNGNRVLFLQLMEKIEGLLTQAQAWSSPLSANASRSATTLWSKDVALDLDNSPWPMYCHDRRHTCQSPYQGLTTQPAGPKWVFTSPGGHGIASPVAIGQDGKLYFGTWKNKNFPQDKMKGHSGLLCVLSPDGKLIWTHDSHQGSLLASGIESSPLLMADGKIIYGKDDGHVYALNQEGKLLWDFSCDDVYDPDNPFDDNEQVISSPVLGPNGIIYICSHWGNVYNPMAIQKLSKIAPLVKEFNIMPVQRSPWSKIYAIDSKTGNRLWVYDLSLGDQLDKRIIFGSPAIGGDGTIYVGTYDNTHNGYLYALNPDGILKWIFSQTKTKPILGLPGSPSIAEDGTIYIGSFGSKKNARLYAVKPDGTLKWSYKVLENRITSTPGIAPDGTIYVGAHNWGFIFNPELSKNGHFYALKDTGKKAELVWQFKVNYGVLAPPAIDNQGNVFFGTYGDPTILGQMGAYRIFALNSKGKTLWSYDLNGRVYSPPVIDKNGTVYVGTTLSEAKLYAFGP